VVSKYKPGKIYGKQRNFNFFAKIRRKWQKSVENTVRNEFIKRRRQELKRIDEAKTIEFKRNVAFAVSCDDMNVTVAGLLFVGLRGDTLELFQNYVTVIILQIMKDYRSEMFCMCPTTLT
jgi:hypothetical protein